MPIKLLLADDSVVIQKLVGLSFANEDIEIITVDNGDDAVSQAIQGKPDVVLADVVMPGKNGYEVCSEIRNNPELAATPVLLLTGTFEAFDEDRANDVGATGHITKPFEAQALVDRVNEILSQRSSADAEHAPAAPSSDFFDDNTGGGPAADVTAARSDDIAFGGAPPPSAPPADPRAETVALDPGSDLNAMLDSAGGDHTVAIMPDMPEPPAAPAQPTAATTAPEVAAPAPAAPTPSPDQTVLVDDFLGSADPMPQPVAPPPLPSEPAPVSAAPMGDIDFSAPAHAGAGSAAAPPPAAADTDDLDLDGLSFGDQPAVPPVDLDGPSGDETVLADDLFGSGSEFARPMSADPMAETEPKFASDPARSTLPPSQGLDIDFGGPAAADSIVPENTDDYDVSASDLDFDPMSDDGSWGNGVPAGVQTAPEPILPQHDVAQPPAPPAPEPDPVGVDFEPSPGLEADWMPQAAVAEPEPAPVAAEAIPAAVELDVTSGGDPGPAPEPASAPSSGLELDAITKPQGELSPDMRDRIHDTLEKIAWEAFSDLSDDIVRQLLKRVEQIAWEVIPQMAETLISEEIRRMKAEEGGE